MNTGNLTKKMERGNLNKDNPRKETLGNGQFLKGKPDK